MKWKELSYDECSWEFESDISSFQAEIEKYKKIRSRYGKEAFRKQKISRDAAELKAKQKEFQQYEKSPEFLTGGKDTCMGNIFMIWKLYIYNLVILEKDTYLSGHSY